MTAAAIQTGRDGMPPKLKVETLNVQMELHREEFKAAEARSVAAREDLGQKVDNLAATFSTGLSKVHTRVDNVISAGNKREGQLYKCVLKWVSGIAGTIILLLLAFAGHLLVNGTPWGTP